MKKVYIEPSFFTREIVTHFPALRRTLHIACHSTHLSPPPTSAILCHSGVVETGYVILCIHGLSVITVTFGFPG